MKSLLNYLSMLYILFSANVQTIQASVSSPSQQAKINFDKVVQQIQKSGAKTPQQTKVAQKRQQTAQRIEKVQTNKIATATKTPKFHEIYIEDGSFDTNYNPNLQNEFMSTSTQHYLDKLKSIFPNASEKNLKTYTLKFLQTHNNQYDTKYIFWADETKPIKTKLDDIIEIPESKELYDLYQELEAEDRAVKQQKNPSNQPILSTTYDNFINSVSQAAQTAVNVVKPTVDNTYQAGQAALNTAQTAWNVGKSTIKLGATAINNFNAFLEIPEVAQFLQEVKNNPQDINAAINKAIEIFGPKWPEYIKQLTQQMQAGNKSTITITPKNQEILTNIGVDLIEKGTQATVNFINPTSKNISMHAVSSVAKEKDNNEIIDVSDSTTQEESLPDLHGKKQILPVQEQKKPITRVTDSFNESPELQASLTKTSNSFNISAQKLPKSVLNLQKFIKEVTSSLAKTFKLTQEQEQILNTEAIQEITNKESWWYTKGSEFNRNFAIWMENLITKCYIMIGKQNPNAQIIRLNQETNNPLTPQVTITYNTKLKSITSAIVQYNGNTYIVPKEQISQDTEGNYTLKTDLFIKQKQTLFDTNFWNPVISNAAKSLKTTQAGKAILGDKAIDQGQSSFSVNPQSLDGTLTLTYNPTALTTMVTVQKNTKIQTTINNQNQNSVTAPIITKKIFISNSSKPISETIEIPTIAGEIHSPDIKFTNVYPKGISKESIVISHFDRQQKQNFNATIKNDPLFDETTDTYTIVAQFETSPTSTPTPVSKVATAFKTAIEKISTAAYESTVKNIERTFTGASLQDKHPEIYNNLKEYLLEAIPTSVETVIVMYTPKANKVTTVTVTPMSDGTLQTIKREYPLS